MMKPNTGLTRTVLVAILLAFAMTVIPSPAGATATTTQSLPPIPEWPIIGPILKWLGVVSVEEEEAPMPTPGLREIRIRSIQDAQALRDVQPGERVRIIASEDDLNAMMATAIAANISGNASVAVDFEPNLMNLVVHADESLLKGMADELPRQIQGDIDLDGAFYFEASACAVQVEIKKIRLNGWSFGLRPLAQRVINNRIPDLWPEELCVERVLLMDDEAAIEGYRR